MRRRYQFPKHPFSSPYIAGYANPLILMVSVYKLVYIDIVGSYLIFVFFLNISKR